ncbi:MAG: class I SAM-dependent methyltransferase [Motiliproteus sp.]
MDNKIDKSSDKAGEGYWNEAWNKLSLPEVWDVDSVRIISHVERELFNYISKTLGELIVGGAARTLVEVGCARSQALPVIANRLGFKVSGIDYSPNGCEQTALILDREGVDGEVFCVDIFSIPDSLVGQFDVVVSFGLIEHFSDTNAVVSALARLLKPGGVILTNIPNMNGSVGFFQRLLNKSIYDIHVPLTPEEVKKAHEYAGLEVVESDFFISSSYGVVNIGETKRSSFVWWARKIPLFFLARVSMAAWLCERLIWKLPVSRFFSPYINCVAVRKSE